MVNEAGIDPSVSAPTAREDAALITRDLRGALAFIAQDGAGDENFIVYVTLVRYDDDMAVAIDIRDRRNVRVSRFEVSASGSKRGWTDAARETAREDIVYAIAGYLRSNR